MTLGMAYLKSRRKLNHFFNPASSRFGGLEFDSGIHNQIRCEIPQLLLKQ